MPILVRPTLVIAHWLKAFDLHVIDGLIHGIAGAAVWVSKWDGIFDRNIIDGLVNVRGEHDVRRRCLDAAVADGVPP